MSLFQFVALLTVCSPGVRLAAIGGLDEHPPQIITHLDSEVVTKNQLKIHFFFHQLRKWFSIVLSAILLRTNLGHR